MKPLVNKASFTILTPDLTDQLLNIERAGRTCYQSDDSDISLKSARKFCGMLIKRGHESVLEHSLLTVKFLNMSRGFTHEQVRHRLTAISQESTRYVDYAKGDVNLEDFQLKCILPRHKNLQEKITVGGAEYTPIEMFEQAEHFYRALRKAGWAPEDARQILPIATKSEIVISANFREWRHIFKMRTAEVAHWEIRSVMCSLLIEIQELLSPIFNDFYFSGLCKKGYNYCKKGDF